MTEHIDAADIRAIYLMIDRLQAKNRCLRSRLKSVEAHLEAAERRAAEAEALAERRHGPEYVRGVMHDRSIREEAAREERRACADIAAAFIEVERRGKLSNIAERIRASILCRDCAQAAQAGGSDE